MDERTRTENGFVDVWMHGAWYKCMDVRMYGCTDVWRDGCMDGCMNVRMSVCMRACMDVGR